LSTLGRTINGTSVQSVTSADCGVANGIDATSTGLCANAGTVRGINGAAVTATANGASAYGSQSLAQDTNTTAIGFRATATHQSSTAMGFQSQANGASSVAVGANAQASASNAVALGAGSVAAQPDTVSVGSPGSERRITNVAPGVNPTDAVNMAQLQGVQRNVQDVAKFAYSGIAMAGALAALPQVENGKTFQIGAGVGNYASYTALAVGGSARLNSATVVRLGASTTNGNHMLLNAGIGYSW
jgi:autotransporter adhesin